MTFYELEIANTFFKKKWKLEKRYKEFSDLHADLSKLCSNCPTIPGKTLLKVTDPEKLEKRRAHLESFLRVYQLLRSLF